MVRPYAGSSEGSLHATQVVRHQTIDLRKDRLKLLRGVPNLCPLAPNDSDKKKCI